jgi:hypothetical protein
LSPIELVAVLEKYAQKSGLVKQIDCTENHLTVIAGMRIFAVLEVIYGCQ